MDSEQYRELQTLYKEAELRRFLVRAANTPYFRLSRLPFSSSFGSSLHPSTCLSLPPPAGAASGHFHSPATRGPKGSKLLGQSSGTLPSLPPGLPAASPHGAASLPVLPGGALRRVRTQPIRCVHRGCFISEDVAQQCLMFYATFSICVCVCVYYV